MISPSEVEVAFMVPAGNSITERLKKQAGLIRNGFSLWITLMTLFCASRKRQSIGKFIKKVCTQLQGLMTSAWEGKRFFLPSRPFNLKRKEQTRMALSAKRVFFVLLNIRIEFKRYF